MTLQIICAALALIVLFDWVLAWSQRRLIVALKDKLANEEGAHRDQVEISEIIQRRLDERNESYSELHLRYVQLDNELARVRLENGVLERRQIQHVEQIDFLKRTKRQEMERVQFAYKRIEELLATNAELAERLADAMTKKRKRS